MKVSTTSGAGAAGGAGKTRPAGASPGFQLPAAGPVSGPGQMSRAGGVGGLMGVDALLALQEMGGPLERKRRAVNRAGRLLDILDEVKLNLIGTVSWQHGIGWARPQRVHFHRMPSRLGALCEIPDLELFPERYAGVQDVMFRAALEVSFTQRMFAAMAWLRQHGVLPRPQVLATLIDRASVLFDWMGTPVGGMVVEIKGLCVQGQPLKLSWHLTAGDHHGPEIPCMAAILLALPGDHGRGRSITEVAPEFAELAAAGTNTKQLQISLQASRTNQTVVAATNTVLSARFILRNKIV